MKAVLRFSPAWIAAAAAVFASIVPARAITDNFTDATNWGTPLLQDGNMSVGSGRMNYTSSSTLTKTGGAVITRKAPLLPTTRDWRLQVDAHLDPFVLTQMEQFSDVFLGFGKTGDWKNNHVTFEFGRGWWDSYNDDHKGYYIQDGVRINGNSVNETLQNPLVNIWGLTSADVSLRMDYKAANHTITYYVDSDGAANGYRWVSQGAASLASGTYNLNLSATDTFTVILVGSSGYQNVASGQAYLSNLEITLEQGTPVLTWEPPAAITYGTLLSAKQLNAKANVPGKFTYTPALKSKLPAGLQTLNVTFNPTDATNYSSASQSVPLTVSKATAKVTVTGLSQAYNGQPRPVTVTTVPAGLKVDVTYAGAAAAPGYAGNHPVAVTVVDDNYVGIANPTLNITKGAQTITFPAPPPLRNGDADYLLPATASSGLPVSYVSSAPALATIVDRNKLHLLGAGKVTITASQAGDANWNAARAVPKALIIGKRSQSIGFSAMADHTLGDVDFSPGASASSSLAVTYTSAAPKVATIVAGKIHLVGKGSAVITASQAGDSNWDVASPVKQTLVVVGGTQNITFPPLLDQGYGDLDFAPGATVPSGLAVSYTSSVPTVATIVAGKIHITGIGTSTITANQGGDVNWAAAPPATQVLTVIKGTPVITWTPPAAIRYGTALSIAQLNAKTNVPGSGIYTPVLGSKLPVGVQTLNVILTPTDSARYNTATKSVTITVNKATATVTLAGLSQLYNGQPRVVTATTVPAGLNVDISYNGSSDAPTVCGSYSVVATVNDPNASGSKSGTLVIGKGNQTISFASLTAMHVGDADRALTATPASGLPVGFSSSTPTVVTIVDGNKLHAVAAGTAIITATQAGDSNWNAAPPFKQLLTVAPSLTTLDIPAYAGLSGTHIYRSTEAGLVSTWSTEVQGPMTKGGRQVYLVQEYDEHDDANDQTFLLADMAAGLYETGGLNDYGQPTESTRYWTPDLPRLMRTFVPGQEYSVTLTRPDMPGISLTWKIKTVAERVTVPCGTFDSYKVDLTVAIPASAGGGSHTDICWYALNVGMIKRDNDGFLWELTEYTR